MKLVLKLLCVSIISCASSEALIQSLYGVKDEFLVTACLRRNVACEGALVWTDWVVVQESCLKAREVTPHINYVALGKHNCTAGETEVSSAGVSSRRYVVERHPYPLVPYIDLALLKLDWPYDIQHYNRSLDPDTLDTLSKLYLIILKTSTSATPLYDCPEPVSYQTRTFNIKSSPFKVFLITVIVPIVWFAAFFIYVIFYTGTPDKSKIPYKNLNDDNEKKVDPV